MTAAAEQDGRQAGPAVSLPRGGGAIRGIGEAFKTNPATGTASLTVPVPVSPGRGGLQPQLELSYDSGAGNGPFGFGWSLSLPRIERKTDRGLPRYDSSDAFLLAGAEELVPVGAEGSREGHLVQRYRPRVEGLQVRIERWTRESDGDVHWRTISRDNVTSVYGPDEDSRIQDPEEQRHVFAWLVAESYDDKGNAILYEYKRENSSGVDPALAREANRTAAGRAVNRYPKRIRYGNVVSRLDPSPPADWREGFHFELVFDYGEGHLRATGAETATATASPAGAWPVRPDPFSSHRSGFEVRTYRRCRRLLMFHRFDELGKGPCLVRATELEYADLDYGAAPDLAAELAHPGSTRFGSFVSAIRQSGFVRTGAESYETRSLPPLELEYSRARIDDEARAPEGLEDLPAGLSGGNRLADLDGEGLAGILSTQEDGGWQFKPPRGGARFGAAEEVVARPSLGRLGGGRQLVDVDGDGRLDLMVLDREGPGLHARGEGGGWEPFQAFADRPAVSLENPNARLVDLDGDGLADVLVTEDEAIACYRSLGADGFAAPERAATGWDEEAGPRLVLADRSDSIYLADMSGDGLSDLVRIRNGEVCYWPNRGYGRFGAKVTMDRAPRFDPPDEFDHARLHLLDVDGSGASDIAYLGEDGARLYLNRSGNEWSDAHPLRGLPPLGRQAAVSSADILGRGTACLVVSTSLPQADGLQVRYVDLMADGKPHLLTRVANNLGAETRVEYAPSTRFYLEDREAGRPWLTRLPFPVQVVERVETLDRVSGNRFVSRYSYHHGHFDGREREFRGFARVDQWDTEEWAAMNAGEVPGGTNFDAASDVPPVLTRTWFHTGAFFERTSLSRALAREYYREPGLDDAEAEAMLLEDSPLPGSLDAEEEREACRALKGTMLRREVYGRDGTAAAQHPYTVTEQSFTVRRLQPRQGAHHAVFLTVPRESIAYTYERNPDDPRVKHKLTLEADDFGNELATAVVAYPRRTPDPSLDPRERAKQAQLRIVYGENEFTNAVEGDDHRAPLAADFSVYELTGVKPPSPPSRRYSVADLEGPPAGAKRRLLQRERTVYRSDDLEEELALGTLESRALPGNALKLAFTPERLEDLFGDRVDEAMLEAAGFVHSEGDGNWWVPTGTVFYSPGGGETAAQELTYARRHFFQPHRHRDPFGAETAIAYDDYDLLPLETRDPLGNRVTAGERALDPEKPLVSNGNDYRVLKPALVMDPNRNRSSAAFDALGLVSATALRGKPEDEPELGDNLEGVAGNVGEAQIAAAMADPIGEGAALLGNATTRFLYDVGAYYRSREEPQPEPPAVLTLARERHLSELEAGGETLLQYALSFSDGFAREIQKKTRAEPEGEAARWAVSGWKVFDNKGNAVREFEPFFSASHGFEPDVEVGVSAFRCYDPLERLVATLYPNHSWEKAVFDAWGRQTWDMNDTVLIADPAADPDVGALLGRLPAPERTPTWYAQRAGGGLGGAEQEAAKKTAVHAATPALLALDSSGQTVLTVGQNAFGEPRSEEASASRVSYDARGNVVEVFDAEDRLVSRFGYDMLGNCLRKESMEAGDRASFENITGKPEYEWDGRGRRLRTVYDALRRPVELRLREGGGAEAVLEVNAYGEGEGEPEAANLRGRVVRKRDQGGVLEMPEYDFKGNMVHSRRRFSKTYAATIDWSGAVALEEADYEHRSRFDALNRPLELTTPDGSRVLPTYNQAGLVERVEAAVRGGAAEAFVDSVAYDAHGRRTEVRFGNGARTRCEYDPETFRLARLATSKGGTVLQDLGYTYDPVGNVTRVKDEAQQEVFFRNRRVEPSCDFTYDALYQLIEASGREHLAGGAPSSWDDTARLGLPHPHDGNALGRYRESYRYDSAGNLLELLHRGTDPLNAGWSRAYAYEEASQLEPGKRSNRLTKTVSGGETALYDEYDEDGNMLRLPQLEAVGWDHRDRLRTSERGGETTYYVYEADGTRLRKVTETAGGEVKEERRYLGGFEVYVRRGAGALTRETLHVRDGSRPVALVETRTDTPSEPLVRYQFADLLDSVKLELDGAGEVISYEEYTPFGATALQTAAPALAAPKRYRYTGKERDEESGLYYVKERYYAPWLGRWTSPDPAGLKESANRYSYVRNRPTALIDPDGRSGVKPGGSGAGSGSGSGASARSGGVLGAIGGFFDSIASGLATAANWLQEWLPGLIAAPVAGLVDILGGFFRTIGGIFSWKGETVLKGLKEMGLGALRIVGLKEVVGEKWDTRLGTSGDFKGPRTLARDIGYAWNHKAKDAWKNGYHSWHAATNAVIAQRIGPNPIAIAGLILGGIIHESPLDWHSFQEEQRNQGTVNHILDSLTDIVSNITGIIIGLLLPRQPAVAVAAWVGRYIIPGPADHDPAVGGAGAAYEGNPLDAWWKWKYEEPPPASPPPPTP